MRSVPRPSFQAAWFALLLFGCTAAATTQGGTPSVAPARAPGIAAGTSSVPGPSTNAEPGSAGAPSGAPVPHLSPLVRVVGRTDGNVASPRFEWSGVSIRARFKGTGASVDLDGGDQNYFEVVVDGKVRPRLVTTPGRKEMTLAAGLPDGPHDLVLWRRSEADNRPSQVFGLDADGGELLPAPPPAHRLEVIGDSITCGYGDEADDPCNFSYDTENQYLAYGSVAARELGADVYTECWSGKGMLRNYDGSRIETLPVLFQRAVPTDSESAWGFSYEPDAVVVNLGTNDFATGDPGSPFVDAYGRFVATLRSHYARAFVFLVIAPMLTGADLARARGYLDQVVLGRRAAGDARVAQILVDAQDPVNGIGCGNHPSVKTHDLMGRALARAIRGALGW